MNYFELMIQLVLKNDKDIDEHLLTLFSMVLSNKPECVFELGVRTARSSLAFLSANQFIDCKLISVDIDPIRADFNFPESWKAKWTFFQKDALKFLEDDLPKILEDRDENRSLIFYVDDWHCGEHVSKELEFISKHVTSKDLIILHDLMYGNSQPNYRSVENPSDKQWSNGGPYAAISKLDLNKWEYCTIPRCHGLTFLRKKSNRILTE
tara:strand:+ start:333 stop:959 length:627 start_codon:yes stop_codon:yes gene_type:complete